VPRRSGGSYGAYQTSDIAIEKVTVSVAKIGHAIITDSDTLADQAGIAALLSTEGVYGVREAMEQQLLASADTSRPNKNWQDDLSELAQQLVKSGPYNCPPRASHPAENRNHQHGNCCPESKGWRIHVQHLVGV
jgi:hypothetical protein